MSQSTFRELLKYTTETAPKPPILATGHYIGEIGNHEFGFSRQKQTPQLTLHLSASEECSDVEANANEGVDLSGADLRRVYYITPKAVRFIGLMLDAVLGPDSGRSFDERIPETRGARVMFGVTRGEREDGTPFNEVTTIVKA